MCGSKDDIRFVKRNVGVIFFIHVQVLNQTLPEEVVECDRTFLEKLKS
jgi:hypothetical protein